MGDSWIEASLVGYLSTASEERDPTLEVSPSFVPKSCIVPCIVYSQSIGNRAAQQKSGDDVLRSQIFPILVTR